MPLLYEQVAKLIADIIDIVYMYAVYVYVISACYVYLLYIYVICMRYEYVLYMYAVCILILPISLRKHLPFIYRYVFIICICMSLRCVYTYAYTYPCAYTYMYMLYRCLCVMRTHMHICSNAHVCIFICIFICSIYTLTSFLETTIIKYAKDLSFVFLNRQSVKSEY